MKKNHAIFVALALCMAVNTAMAAVTVKKAAPVATQETSATGVTSSLVPTVLNLVSGVQQLSAKQRELTTECIPSSAEITFVDNAMKEWAKTGAMTADEVSKRLGRRPCDGGRGYNEDIRYAISTGFDDVCYDSFVGTGNDGMVWEGFPKVGIATRVCPSDPDSSACSEREQKTLSDIYEIFNLIDFGEKDYTRQEATMAAKLLSKIDNCSNARLSKRKREMWGEFLVNTMGSVGQKTNTTQIMQTVSGMTQNGVNINSGLSSLGAIATQFMNK